MTVAITFKTIIEEVIEQTGLGLVLPSVTGTTTQLTLANAYLQGPFPQTKIQRGSPILTTAGTAINENTYANLYTPSTGVITVSPSVSDTFTDAVLCYYGMGIDHFDRVKEAINRALANRTYRWEPRPLTFVPDGDLQGTTVADYWTAAANGTAAYASAQAFPAGSAADAVGSTRQSRVLQLTSTGATSVTGNGMRVIHTSQQRGWYFLTSIRLVSGSGTATFSIRDNTNAADIALQVTRGNDSNTLTTTTFGDFMVCEGTFMQPATCDEVAPRLTLSATGMVAQMGPVIMFPLDAVSFPLPDRLMSSDDVGNFMYGTSLAGPGAPNSVIFSDPITTGGYTHKLMDYGDHMTVMFNFRPTRAVWYEEAVYGPALTALTDTTTFPLETVVRAATFELQKYRARHDKKYQQDAIEAQKAARYSDPSPLTVVGRVA